MTDIDKKIAELEDLRAKATPGEWRILASHFEVVSDKGPVFTVDEYLQIDLELVVETHNVLPKLIAGYKRYRQETVRLLASAHDKANEVDAAIARADKAEKRAKEAEKNYRNLSVEANKLEERAEKVEEAKKQAEISLSMITMEKESMCGSCEVTSRLEQMQKERDTNKLAVAALARELAHATRGWAKAGNVDNSVGYWTAWAYADAQEAAKAEAGEVEE